MCNYRIDNLCKVSNTICPWVYWCDKLNIWKELSKKPKECRVAGQMKLEKGYYEVRFERNGYLYVLVDNEILKFKNIFDVVPLSVKLYQSNGEWKLQKE